MKTCGHNTPCGCSDKALTTPPPCDTTGACTPNASACAETFCLNCATYCEEDMEGEVGGETFIFRKGQNLNSIVQALIATMNDPQCGAYTAIDLRITSQTEDSITIAWDSLNPICVTIDWGTGTSPLLSETVKQFTIPGLVSDTEYRIKILTDGVPCASVTIITKTL
jgi:hypothetical protein